MSERTRYYQPERFERTKNGIRRTAKAIKVTSEVAGNLALSTAGLSFIFGLLQHAIGIHVSIPLPFDSHFTWAGSVGDPSHLTNTLPGYLQGHVNNISDGSGSVEAWHWGFMGGESVATIGNQPGSPAFDLGINLVP